MSKKYSFEDIVKEVEANRKTFNWSVGDGWVSIYTNLDNELGLDMDGLTGEVENMEQLIELRDTGTLKDWE